MKTSIKLLTIAIFLAFTANTAIADTFWSGMPNTPTFGAKHGAQGTGNYKGKRDRHEKPTPQNEKKKKSGKWSFLRK